MTCFKYIIQTLCKNYKKELSKEELSKRELSKEGDRRGSSGGEDDSNPFFLLECANLHIFCLLI